MAPGTNLAKSESDKRGNGSGGIYAICPQDWEVTSRNLAAAGGGTDCLKVKKRYCQFKLHFYALRPDDRPFARRQIASDPPFYRDPHKLTLEVAKKQKFKKFLIL